MFERFTEAARRAMYFSRLKAGQCGSAEIAPVHLLIGTLEPCPEQLSDMLVRLGVEVELLLDQLANSIPKGRPIADSADIPFNKAVQRILQHAMAEADRLADRP